MPSPLHIPRRHTPDQIESLFAAQRTGDLVGVRIHLALAIGACLMAGWPTTYVEWAALPVLICFLIRMTGWHRLLEPLAFDRVVRPLLAWGAWVALSLLWTCAHGKQEGSNAPAWLMDIRTLRFLPLFLLLWPVLDRRSLLILALMAGIACGEASQLIHLLGKLTGWSWIPYHRASGRLSGWWDPVSGGTVLCAGLGLWLAPALWGTTTRIRWLGTLGTLATLGCIALTGTRGAWIGAALLLAIAGLLRLLRTERRAIIFPFGAAMAAACILAAGAAFIAIERKHDASTIGIAQRFQAGIDEVRNAFGPEGWKTDTGLRIAMWRWAIIEWRTHPIIGVGAGGFHPWVQSRTPEEVAHLHAPEVQTLHAQAHSTYFHTLATLGAVGFVLLIATLIAAIFSGIRSATTAATSHWQTSLASGPGLGLIGLACAGLFDTITVNQQPSYLFYMLIALCLPSRPRELRLYEPSAQAEDNSRASGNSPRSRTNPSSSMSASSAGGAR